MPRRNLLWVLLLVVTAAVVYFLRPQAVEPPSAPGGAATAGFEQLREVRDIVAQYAVSPVDDQKLLDGAIRGMLQSIDAYSDYYPPAIAADFAAASEGAYSGIGVEVESRNGRLIVISCMDASPAALVDILPGDILLEAGGQSLDGLTQTEAVSRLKGTAGSELQLTVLRPSTGERLEKRLTRGNITTSSVRGWLRRDRSSWDYWADEPAKIGYIRITQFMPHTAEELTAAVNGLLRQGVKGIVLDVRFNPGGQFESAINCADLFLNKGVIVIQQGRAGQTRSWQARPEGTLPDLPLVVLVNRFSASAAEIFAGALRDNHRAMLVGENTWGKGTVQTPIRLNNGGIVKLTTSRYLLPSGQSIHRMPDSKTWGVQPDVSVPMSAQQTANLLSLERLDAIRFAQHGTTQPTTQTSAPATQPADLAAQMIECDVQLDKAVDLLTNPAKTPATEPAD